MNTKMAGYLILHGAFVVCVGGAGFLWNPGKANTPLLAFTAFGVVAAGLGVMGARGVWGSLPLALASLVAFMGLCVWRTCAELLEVINGRQEQLSAAIALFLMAAASATVVVGLLKTRSRNDLEPRGRRAPDDPVLR